MDFRSDNVTKIAPEILAAILAANEGWSSPYGADDQTRQLQTVLSDVFEREVAAFPVSTGTAANALALAALTPPFGAIYCFESAHIMVDECGAPEFFTGGAKVRGLKGDRGKISARELDLMAKHESADEIHWMRPACVSISQTNEYGCIYAPKEIAEIGAVARDNGLRFHMDGTRFAYAIAASGAKPSEMTWKAGVDAMSLGATKNGALGAEAVVFFDKTLAQDFERRRKRGGQIFSKGRFVSAQLVASFRDGLWLRLAGQGIAAAQRLAAGLIDAGIELAFPTESNAVFAKLPLRVYQGLLAAGFNLYPGSDGDPTIVRLMASFQTEIADVDRLVETVRRLKGA